MNATDLTEALRELLEGTAEAHLNDDDTLTIEADAGDATLAYLRTFREAGLLTSDDGLVVRTADGSEFQLTVMQSR